VLYFTYFGRTPAEPICPKICMWGDVPDVITCAKFQNEILRVCNSTGGRNSHFLLIFEWPLQQSSATALPVIHGSTRVYSSNRTSIRLALLHSSAMRQTDRPSLHHATGSSVAIGHINHVLCSTWPKNALWIID